MTEKILFVDDELLVLQAMERQLRRRFSLEVACGGEEALRVLETKGPFAVIVSDMRMPGMNGVQLLAEVKNSYPDTVRMMLTGNADQATAMEAVNTGEIFRFLTKPCPTATLIISLALAQRQYRLLTAEKELLQQTLKGSINVLSELLAIANPMAYSSGSRIKNYVVRLAEIFGLPAPWQYEIAALMSQIGSVTLPAEVLGKVFAGQEMSEEEQQMYAKHPEVGAKLLEKIPRLENVTKMIALQQTRYDAYTEAILDDYPEEVITGAQILKAVIDFDLQLFQGATQGEALTWLRKQKGRHNREIIDALAGIKVEEQFQIVVLHVQEIVTGMIPVEDILAKNGSLIIPKGQTITWPLVQGLKNFARQVGVVEPIKLQVRHAAVTP